MTGWQTYWLTWFIVTFVVGFLPAELYTLFTNSYNTLSWSIWRLEGFIPGQSFTHWTAIHFLVGGMFVILFVWLIGHFTFGIWA